MFVLILYVLVNNFLIIPWHYDVECHDTEMLHARALIYYMPVHLDTILYMPGSQSVRHYGTEVLNVRTLLCNMPGHRAVAL